MTNSIQIGDCRDIMRDWAAEGVKVQTCVTSPPYFGLRDYGVAGQIGLEQTPDEYVRGLVEVFRCVRDILANDGTVWLNLGDSYAGSGKGRLAVLDIDGLKPKDLIGIPWRVAFALQADGWYLRQDIIWAKGTSGCRREGNTMPESVRDRCTKAHEYLFLLSKSPRYYFDIEANSEPAKDWGTRDRSKFRMGTTDPKLKHHGLTGRGGKTAFRGQGQPRDNETGRANRDGRDMKDVGVSLTGNRRSVWRVNPTPFKGAHFATFPPDLIEPCILAGSRPGDIVLDPFMGSGTTAGVALKHGRCYLGCELNPAYQKLQPERIAKIAGVNA